MICYLVGMVYKRSCTKFSIFRTDGPTNMAALRERPFNLKGGGFPMLLKKIF